MFTSPNRNKTIVLAVEVGGTGMMTQGVPIQAQSIHSSVSLLSVGESRLKNIGMARPDALTSAAALRLLLCRHQLQKSAVAV